VARPKRVAIAVSRKFKLTEDRICSAQLAFCREDTAPSRYMDDGMRRISMRYLLINSNHITDVVPLCTVKADLRDVPVSKFMRARARNGGQEFYIADFSIELLVDNSVLKFFLMFDGEEYGSIVPNFEG
jgi:hypothetical protein